MVKRWLILFLALVTLSLVPGVLAVCYDSDGGINIFVKGYTQTIVNGTNGTQHWDSCIGSSYVAEKYCSGGNEATTNMSCITNSTNMCSDGRCINNQTTQNGTLNVTSNPSGANLYVDNILRGTTPRTVSLVPGSHGVRLTKTGYQDYTTTVNIVAGQTTNLYVVLILNPTNATHLECVNNYCTMINGSGSNQCSPQGSYCGQNQTNQTVDGCSYLPQWAKNNITLLENGGSIVVKKEGDRVYYHQYVVVPTNPYILLVIMIENMSDGYSNDFVDFRDLNGITYRSITSAEGEGIITFGGTVYLLRYYGSATSPPESRYITLDFPQTQGSIKMTFYCSMQPLPSNLKPTPLPSTGSIRPSPPECNWLRKFFGLFGIGDC